jgi:hypothetical protein
VWGLYHAHKSPRTGKKYRGGKGSTIIRARMGAHLFQMKDFREVEAYSLYYWKVLNE